MKQIRRFSTYQDPQKLEIYLRQQHQAGQALQAIHGFSGKLTFATIVPEDVVYRLDYYETKGGFFQPEYDHGYRKLFADAGWEFVTSMMPYVVFRQPVMADTDPRDLSLYSDRDSLLAYHKKVLYRQLRMVAIPLLFPLSQDLMTIATGGEWRSGRLVFLGLVLLTYAGLASYFISSYRQKAKGLNHGN